MFLNHIFMLHLYINAHVRHIHILPFIDKCIYVIIHATHIRFVMITGNHTNLILASAAIYMSSVF